MSMSNEETMVMCGHRAFEAMQHSNFIYQQCLHPADKLALPSIFMYFGFWFRRSPRFLASHLVSDRISA